MENVKNYIPIFSQRLAGILMTKGFVLMDMRTNDNGSGKNVFYFRDSKALNLAIAEYTTQRKG